MANLGNGRATKQNRAGSPRGDMSRLFRLRIVLLICALQVVCFADSVADQKVVAKALVFSKAGKMDQAEALLRSASTANPNSATLHAALGQLLLSVHKFDDAVMELGQAAQQKPESAKYNLLAAEALIGAQRYPTAVKFLKAIEPRFGNDAHFHYQLGVAYYYESNLNATLAELQEAVRLSPRFERAEFLLANCLVVSGETLKALTIFRRLAREHPNNAFYWATLGIKGVHVDKGGSAEESLLAVRHALALAPDDNYVQIAAATVFTQTGQYKEARPLLEGLEKVAPGELEPHTLLVQVYARLGERDLAQKEIEIVEKLQKEAAAKQAAQPSVATPGEDGQGSPSQP